MAAADRVCVGVIGGVHGVKGVVRIRPFTADPADVVAYGPLTDAAGKRVFAVRLLSMHKGQWLARIDGVEDRDAAAALRGTRLFAERARMPEPEPDEYYHADLIGLAAVGTDGRPVGTVRAVHDFGAGDILEIAAADGSALMVPFTRQAVPDIDVAGRRIVVEPPAYMAEEPEEPDGETE